MTSALPCASRTCFFKTETADGSRVVGSDPAGGSPASTRMRASAGSFRLTSRTAASRLLRGAGELHHDEAHFLREVRMTHQRHSHIGIELLAVILAERDDVDTIERRDQNSGRDRRTE